jgi:hypothetical protein
MAVSCSSRILRELLESAGRLAAWSEDVSPETRLRVALAAYDVRVRVGPVELAAHVDESLALSVTVAGAAACTPVLERALRAALRDHPSPVARLVDAEWARVLDGVMRRSPEPDVRPPKAQRRRGLEMRADRVQRCRSRGRPARFQRLRRSSSS